LKQLPVKAFGAYPCKPKIYYKDISDINYKQGEGKGIEVWQNRPKVQ